MIWLNPFAWLGLAAVAAPVIVHFLAHRRAERVPFPTLRFLRPTRLAAIRRRALEDVPLLLVRAAIVAAAAVAFAGPLVLTSARRAAWNGRRVVAVVTNAPGTQELARRAFRSQVFTTNALQDGIHRAVAWLQSAPPARRELVIAAPLAMGSLTDADLAGVPADVGVRFVRTASVPAAASIDGARLVADAGVVRQTVTLSGPETSVREERTGESAAWPIEVIAAATLQQTADAAVAAVRAARVPLAGVDRRARVVLVGQGEAASRASDAAPIRSAWMADAVARVARDPDLKAVAARATSGLADPQLGRAPWLPIATTSDGRPVAVTAAALDRWLIVARADAGDLMVPVLVRAIATALAAHVDRRAAEILPIDEAQLRAWSREPGPAPAPKTETIDGDDRRWLWGAVLVLLVHETWIRRSRRDASTVVDVETARVA